MTTPDPQADAVEQYTVQYDRLDDEPLTVTVATALATFLNEDVTALEPLHNTVNADALERLFEPRANALRTGGTVSFPSNGCLVTVDAAGTVTVAKAPVNSDY